MFVQCGPVQIYPEKGEHFCLEINNQDSLIANAPTKHRYG
jgi:hypothetical protein